MKITELNREDLSQVKCVWYNYHLEETEGRNISFDELFHIDDYVSDKKIFEELKDYDFTEDDFMSEMAVMALATHQ